MNLDLCEKDFKYIIYLYKNVVKALQKSLANIKHAMSAVLTLSLPYPFNCKMYNKTAH